MIDPEPLIINTASEPLGEDDNREMLFMQLEAELKNSKTPGVGLAAVQIGILARAAIIRTTQSTLNLWNPEITERDGEVISPEGCLSFPGISRSIKRAKEITVKNGDGRTYQFDGFDAIVVQHEIDHLDGINILNKNYASMKIGRNKLCPCGSRKKFKKCHLASVDASRNVAPCFSSSTRILIESSSSRSLQLRDTALGFYQLLRRFF